MAHSEYGKHPIACALRSCEATPSVMAKDSHGQFSLNFLLANR